LLQIDGVNRSGAVEYFLYKRKNGTWQPLSDEINGCREGYVQEIENLFGSLTLFLRSAFVSQKEPKNLLDLGGTTKRKKALFRELGGLDYLQMYADYLKDCVKIHNDEIITEKTKIEEYEKAIEKKQELEASLDELGDLVRKEGELNEKRTKTL
jgi:hypothetical protein